MSYLPAFCTNDAIEIDGLPHRYLDTTATDVVLQTTSGIERAVTYPKAELQALLRTSRILIRRGALALGGARANAIKERGFLVDLPASTASQVLLQEAYVVNSLDLEAPKTKLSRRFLRQNMKKILRRVERDLSDKQRSTIATSEKWKRILRLGPSPETLQRWIKNYSDAGMSQYGLIPKTYLSGNRNKRFCLDACILLSAGARSYCNSRRPTQKIVAEDTIEAFKIANLERMTAGLPAMCVPSESTVIRAIQRLDKFEVYAARWGIERAKSKFAVTEEGVRAEYPLERVEVDEWEIELITILAESGALGFMTAKERASLKCGRRWAYVAIDCATKCILSIRISASQNGQDAVEMLHDITRDKSHDARKCGCESGWNQAGVPVSLFSDNGAAFISEAFRLAAGELNISLARTPAGVPKLRGTIERLFQTFATCLMPYLHARTFSRVRTHSQ